MPHTYREGYWKYTYPRWNCSRSIWRLRVLLKHLFHSSDIGTFRCSLLFIIMQRKGFFFFRYASLDEKCLVLAVEEKDGYYELQFSASDKMPWKREKSTITIQNVTISSAEPIQNTIKNYHQCWLTYHPLHDQSQKLYFRTVLSRYNQKMLIDPTNIEKDALFRDPLWFTWNDATRYQRQHLCCTFSGAHIIN